MTRIIAVIAIMVVCAVIFVLWLAISPVMAIAGVIVTGALLVLVAAMLRDSNT